VTKKEIVRTISEEIGLTQLQTKEIVQRTFDAIVETLVEDTRAKLLKGKDEGPLGRIELRNFGVFEVKRRAPRRARNPRTSAPVDVPAKYVVTFKPGKEMEERVRQLELETAEAARPRQGEPAGRDASAGSIPERLGASAGYGSGSTES
jgi:integration host factor subunit beta